MGLRQEIKNAKSESEINAFLNTGKTYEYASPRTKSSWKSTAKNRLLELTNVESTQNVEKVVQPKKSSKKTK
jgi:hypothetical protein